MSSLLNRMLRFVWKFLNKTALYTVSRIIAPSADRPLKHPPVFLLGAPRCGSTLIMQVLTDAFNVGYLSNAHAWFFGMPAVVEKLFHPLKNKPISNYQSQHGLAEGKHAPSECGAFWYNYFRANPAYIPIDEIDHKKMKMFRSDISSLINAFDRPVFFKNLYASLRLRALIEYFPEALFIIIRRDEIENGHSILEVRKKVFGNYDEWWSIAPPNFESIKKQPPYEQVIEQIRQIYRQIEKDRNESGVAAERFITINYDEFCTNVPATLDIVAEFLKQNNVELESLHQVPKRFSRRSHVTVEKKILQKLREYSIEKL